MHRHTHRTKSQPTIPSADYMWYVLGQMGAKPDFHSISKDASHKIHENWFIRNDVVNEAKCPLYKQLQHTLEPVLSHVMQSQEQNLLHSIIPIWNLWIGNLFHKFKGQQLFSSLLGLTHTKYVLNQEILKVAAQNYKLYSKLTKLKTASSKMRKLTGLRHPIIITHDKYINCDAPALAKNQKEFRIRVCDNGIK